MSIQRKIGTCAFALCTLFASSVMADAVVVDTQIDEATKGSWMGVYGSCYNVLPQGSGRECLPEIEIGPDFVGSLPNEQYDNDKCDPEFEDAVCIGGAATDQFDVRIFSNAPPTPGDGDSLDKHAFVWGFEDDHVEPGTAQQNACQSPNYPDGPIVNYPSTFDSDLYEYDPLSGELKVLMGGDATIAYYFLDDKSVCRAQHYELLIGPEGSLVSVASGDVFDIAQGKYVVFTIEDIPDNALVRLDVTKAEGGDCQSGAIGEPVNSHMSGIFVDGTDACRDPFCGDGNVDPGETCDPEGSAIDPEPSTGPQVCSATCNYCGDGNKDPGEECDPTDTSDPNANMCSDSCEIIPPEVIGCRFTGGLKDVFENNHYRAGGQAGANTALQPQPKGEWTHRQQKGPAGKFTFHGGTASAPEGSEIDVIRCSDPGGCKPSGDPPSPAKQLDFDGIGTFKNIGKKNGGGIPDFVKDEGNTVKVGHGNKNFNGTFHWFEVNIDDLGEPGNTNPNKNPGDGTEACPANGFGEKGDQELAHCSCSDFYRITIYDGVKARDVTKNADGSIDPSQMKREPGDVIYEVQGYIDGGNLQLHHLTGFDLK